MSTANLSANKNLDGELDNDTLCSGMFSDELDRMGYPNQVISGLRLNRPGLCCFGEARTVRIETMETDDENIRLGLGFLERLGAGQLLCVSGSEDYAYFGELMSRLSIRQGLGGAVIGGLTRDHRFTRTLEDFPVFATGYSPKDIKGRGRVHSVDTPIEICGVSVTSRDWIFGDDDGVVVIPSKLTQELFGAIAKIVRDEQSIVSKIDQGRRVEDILSLHQEF